MSSLKKAARPPLIDDHGRRWMQDDWLKFRHENSCEVTAVLVKSRAKQGNLRFAERGEGNLISSMVAPGKHLPILDLDLAHTYVPSSTPGHGHLYLNEMYLDDLQHHAFIKSLVLLGILDRGSLAQIEGMNMSLVRAPGVKK